ncbi:hypothetical protein NUKP32_52990 [Klebsiella variicola]|nr:Uncharacterised protein [Klebsiella variicola]SLW84629.1 Uncharacterised protein [Klebsiella variicola]SLY51303.1 Uncharacterised protein [Klebsiella variicola]SMA31421.1 Uncharacterised protein [Klebsiella variicola]SMA32906.1 Uncharacterised protein [Klebsiella variicola]
MAISFFIFTVTDGLGEQANLIYIFSVALQAFVFAGVERNTGESLVSFLAVYNLFGFALMLAYVIACSLPIPDLSSILVLVSNGGLAILGSILTIVSLATDYKLEVSSVNYTRLPLTIVFSYLFLGERLSFLVWVGIITVLILVLLLSRNAEK